MLNSTLNPTLVPTDAMTLELAITTQIRQALEPFDIQVISDLDTNFTVPAGSTFPISTNSNNATGLLRENNLLGDPALQLRVVPRRCPKAVATTCI